jgi:hypothetical protein
MLRTIGKLTQPLTFALAGLLVGPLAATAQAQDQAQGGSPVIISEIMYNPASNERSNGVEWVEIYNTGSEQVSIGGWYIRDNDGVTVTLPDDATLRPGEAAVLFDGQTTLAQFQDAWGTGFKAYPLASFSKGTNPMRGLSNSGNEQLALYTNDDALADMVDYKTKKSEGWPASRNGTSIFVAPGKLDAAANDQGSSWKHSKTGQHGAVNVKVNEVFDDKRDCGSPGVVYISATEANPTASEVQRPGESEEAAE